MVLKILDDDDETYVKPNLHPEDQNDFEIPECKLLKYLMYCNTILR